MATRWIGFRRDNRPGFGRLVDETILVHEGDLFADPRPTGEEVALEAVAVDLPCRPSKLIALWNNFGAFAEKQGLGHPAAPLFFIKPPNTYHPAETPVRVPEAAGRILYEGELGVVVGRQVRDAGADEAAAAIFGYTLVNDVTAHGMVDADPSFPQWTRAKGFDGFCPFGPVIATGLDVEALTLRTLVNGRERQGYPLADMLMKPARLVALLSRGMTLEAGDVIACGTSLGAGPIPRGATVEVVVDGIGRLANRFE